MRARHGEAAQARGEGGDRDADHSEAEQGPSRAVDANDDEHQYCSGQNQRTGPAYRRGRK